MVQERVLKKYIHHSADTCFYTGIAKALQDPGAWKTPGVRARALGEKAGRVPGSQTERQKMWLETEHRFPWLFV